MKRVLVTGAAGFIGSSLVDCLLMKGCQVIGIDNFNAYYDPAIKRRNLTVATRNPRFTFYPEDIRDRKKMIDIWVGEKPEGVVHLAACVGNRRSLDSADDYSGVNVEGTANLLHACRSVPPRAFVFISTANIYDHTASLPFREGETPDSPRTPYSSSKKEAELLVLAETGHNRFPVTILRFSTVYGPRQRPDMGISLFCRAMYRGEAAPVIGDGEEKRDYVYVADGVDAIVACLDRPLAGEIVNIGSGHAITTKEVLEVMGRMSNRSPRFRCQPADHRDTSILCSDIAKAERLLGWKPATAFAEGMARFLEWWYKEEKR